MKNINNLVLIVCFFIVSMPLNAVELLSSISGKWQMVEEYGEKQPQNEILSFSENGHFSANGIQCGRYFLSNSSLSLLTGKYGRETEISLKWKKAQHNLLLTTSTFEKANIYKQISSIADSCDITKDWNKVNQQEFSFSLPKEWSYKIEKQTDGQHYRVMIANPDATKIINLMLTKLINKQKAEKLNSDQFLLDAVQQITKDSPYPSSLNQDTQKNFPQYTLKQGNLYYASNKNYKLFASTGKINDWQMAAIMTYSKDQLEEISNILKSMKFDKNKLTND